MGLLRTLFGIFMAYRKARKNLEACRRMPASDFLMEAYRQGNYEQAKAFALDPFMQAEVLIQLGRAVEAEPILRSMAATEEAAKPRALVMSQLGTLMLHQGRYDESMEHLQQALQLWPERGSTYRAIAEWHLRRGGNPAEALRWARLAVEKEKAGPGLSPESRDICLAEDLSTLAWAVAAHSQDGAEVDRLCEEIAFPAMTPASSLAMSSFLFGKAWAAVGATAQSAAHFESAFQRDRNGLWGREAAAQRVTNPA